MNLSYHNDPFPHIVGSLDSDLYEQVNKSWENINHTDYSESAGNRSNIQLEDPELLSKLVPFIFNSYEKFLPNIFDCYPKLLQKEGISLSPRILYSENIPSDKGYKIRGLHLDTGDKIVVGLWYFKHPEDIDSGGDLILMNPKTKESKKIEYGSNVFVIFPNVTTAWHMLTPRKPSKYPRRYINLLLESPDTKLHNYQRTGTSVDDEFRGKLVNYYE
jgi:hypothetical protein